MIIKPTATEIAADREQLLDELCVDDKFYEHGFRSIESIEEELSNLRRNRHRFMKRHPKNSVSLQPPTLDIQKSAILPSYMYCAC